jgi:hypothetical protein
MKIFVKLQLRSRYILSVMICCTGHTHISLVYSTRFNLKEILKQLKFGAKQFPPTHAKHQFF